MQQTQSLIERVLKLQTADDVDTFLSERGDQLDWRPLGGNPNNYGVISMGADAWDGIAERITNAVDAVIEAEVELRPELKSCTSPRQAIERIFGFRGGNLKGCPDDRIGELASRIRVKFLDSGEAKKPTVEVWDKGIGQHPSDFPATLVGLNRGYKVTKFYLMGAFGQGGQTTFSRCQYGIVVSRKHPTLLGPGQADLMGWTIVRYRDPSGGDAFYKHGQYEYCVVRGTTEVPFMPAAAVQVPFEHGTMVRLVNYDLAKGTGDVLQPNSTAWGFLNQSLFDPPLPFRLFEARTRFEARNQSIVGLARRLWRGGKGEKAEISPAGSYLLDLGAKGSVQLNYWTLSPKSETDRWADIKKNLVTASNAVFVTLNGQRHSVDQTSFLRDRVNLAYSHNYVIVQVDCDGLTKEAKKDLFSSTRDRLIESDFKDTLLEEIALHLKGDRNLLAFENERRDRFLAHRSEKDTSRIKRMVGQFIQKNPELRELVRARSKIKDEHQKQVRAPPEPDEDDVRPEELETLDLKEVPTFLTITNARNPIMIEKGGNAQVRLEADARDQYFAESWENHFRCIHSKGLTIRKSVSNLRNGKVSYFVSCPSTVRVSSQESLRFELDRPGMAPLIVERAIVCVPPSQRQKEKSRKPLPEPNIVPVSESEQPELWSQLSWSDKSVGRVMTAEDPGIYVSVDNKHLKRVLEGRKLDADLKRSVEERYVAGIAYFLLLQLADRTSNGAGADEDSGADDSDELDRLARTVAVMAVPPESDGGR